MFFSSFFFCFSFLVFPLQKRKEKRSKKKKSKEKNNMFDSYNKTTTSPTFSSYFPSKSAVKKERYLTLYKVPGCFECVFSNPTISLKCFRLVDNTYRKCFKILNTTKLPSKTAQKNRADPDQTASKEAVCSGSSLFAFLTIVFVNSSLDNQYDI